MMLNCSACKKKVSEAAIACPKCGHPLADDAKFQKHREAMHKAQGPANVIAGIVLISVMSFCTYSMSTPHRGEPVSQRAAPTPPAAPPGTAAATTLAPVQPKEPITLPAGRTFASLNEDERARLVERAVRRTGERKPLAGHGTAPTTDTVHIVRPKGGGLYTPIFQQVEFVHLLAGTMGTGITIYRVGFALGRACIVVRSGLGPKGRYRVAWEDWPGELRRAGSPPSAWLQFSW